MSDVVYSTDDELSEALAFLRRHFDVARVVHPVETAVDCAFGTPADRCYEVWAKSERCRNCISARVLVTGDTVHKLERAGNGDIFLVTSERIVTPRGAAVLELVSAMEPGFREHYEQEADEFATLQELNVLVFQDSLTGIFNRRYAEERVNRMLDDPGEGLTLCALVDIDDLKRANDTFGHAAGDALIRHVVSRILQVVSIEGEDGGFMARIGGDEFMIVMRVPNHAAGVSLLEHAARAVNVTNVGGVDGLAASVCIGVSFSDEGKPQSFEELLTDVDKRLYAAKRQGKNRVVGEDPRAVEPPVPVEGERRTYRRRKEEQS